MLDLDISRVGVNIGTPFTCEIPRIALPYMNVGMYIGDETPNVWPPDVLRNAADGTPLLTPDGQTLLIAGP